MEHFFHGKILDIRVAEVGHSLIDLLHEANFVAVRSIDSTASPESIRKVLSRYGIKFHDLNGNTLLSKDSFLDSLAKQTFTGFDELWFYQGYPAKDLSHLPRATSDSADFSISIPPFIRETAQETGCLFLAGDGDGLNYLTPDARIVEVMTKMASRKRED